MFYAQFDNIRVVPLITNLSGCIHFSPWMKTRGVRTKLLIKYHSVASLGQLNPCRELHSNKLVTVVATM